MSISTSTETPGFPISSEIIDALLHCALSNSRLGGPNGFRRNIVNKRCKMSPYDHAVHGKESPRMRIPIVRTNFSHFGR